MGSDWPDARVSVFVGSAGVGPVAATVSADLAHSRVTEVPS